MNNNPAIYYANKRVKFVGDYAKLKGMGYTFQKLFADDRLTWHNDNAFIFKHQGVFKYANYDFRCLAFIVAHILAGVAFDDIKIELTSPIFSLTLVEFYQNNDTQEVNIDRAAYQAWRKASYDAFHNKDSDFDICQWSAYSINLERWNELKALADLGWLELVEHN